MNLFLTDSDNPRALWPITALRHTADIRFGYFTIREKWALVTGRQPMTSGVPEAHDRCEPAGSFPLRGLRDTGWETAQIERLSDLFSLLGSAIETDASLLTGSGDISDELEGANVLGRGTYPLLVFPGAKAEGATINLRLGPVILGPDSEVMEGALIRGPFALGARSQVRMGAKIYGPTSIGSDCKVGGELSNVLMLDKSNKAHDGFLGNSIIGEWCNLGADTNCSNLKNNYSEVRQWNYATEKEEPTGLRFCGLVMGDHAKAGINTMFNTGTVVGVGANVFGGGFPPKFIPDFSWGGAEGLTEFHFDRFLETARSVMGRRGISPTSGDLERWEQHFNETRHLRNRTK